MPRTASSAFFELLAGFVSFVAGMLAFFWRKVSAMPTTWKMAGLTIIGGMVTGFALPIASSYQTAQFYVPPPVNVSRSKVLEVPTLSPPPETVAAADRDSEVERLKARNRRLEALLAALRQRSAE
jgi:hypothetical protein